MSKLSLTELTNICNGLTRDMGILPWVVVGCSNLVFVYSNYISLTDAVAKHPARFAGPGLITVPFCDGNTRPISKQATKNPIVKRELCQITTLCLRNQIRSLRDQIANDLAAKTESFSKNVVSLSRKLKANETQATQTMQRNFVEELDHELHQSCAYSFGGESARGYIEEIVFSEF